MTDTLDEIEAAVGFYEYELDKKSNDLVHAQSITILDLQKRVTALENYIMKIVFDKSLQSCNSVLN